MKYKQQYDGDLVQPRMSSYRMMCCDCSLVHELRFFVKCHGRRHTIRFKITENKRATAAARRKRKYVD